jgi:cytochrome oxidase Cu insertion factor (SCO1/SenC/PrrC family)
MTEWSVSMFRRYLCERGRAARAARGAVAILTILSLALQLLFVVGVVRCPSPIEGAPGELREDALLAAGQVAPLFTLPNLEGQTVQLASYIGKKVVILSLWATW